MTYIFSFLASGNVPFPCLLLYSIQDKIRELLNFPETPIDHQWRGIEQLYLESTFHTVRNPVYCIVGTFEVEKQIPKGKFLQVAAQITGKNLVSGHNKIFPPNSCCIHKMIVWIVCFLQPIQVQGARDSAEPVVYCRYMYMYMNMYLIMLHLLYNL